MKKKTLCDFSKSEVQQNLPELINIVANPKYICRKCARAVNKEEYLCKPVKISKIT